MTVPEAEQFGRPMPDYVSESGGIRFTNCRIVDDPGEWQALEDWSQMRDAFEAALEPEDDENAPTD